MAPRNEVSPRPLDVELAEEGIYVTYDNNRRAFYNGVPEPVSGRHRCRPGKDIHVLVTDETGREGVLTYVNEIKTEDEILESSGVGRVILEPGESIELFPGVRAQIDGMAVEIIVDFTETDERVFVFEEDERGEAMFEIRESED